MKKIKIILVHGTFAKMTNWDDCGEEKGEAHNVYKGDSPFVRELRQALKKRDVELTVATLNWSGKNSHQARRQAALEMNRMLQGLDDPEAFRDGLFVIAHSHGGTVARLALNLSETGRDPDGVITFGSPFVRFVPRPIRRMLNYALWSYRLITVCLATLGASVVVRQAWWIIKSHNNADMKNFVFWLATFVICTLIALLFDKLIRRSRDGLVAMQEQLRDQYDPPRHPGIGYLNYHARFDEAGLLLRFWSIPTWLTFTILSTIFSIGFFTVVAGFGGVVLDTLINLDVPLNLSILEPVMTFFGGAPVGEYSIRKFIYAITEVGSMIILALIVLVSVVAPIGIYVPWLFRRTGFAFGGEKALWNIASVINVDRVASSSAEMRLVFLPRAWRRGRSQHSFYYEDPDLRREIVDRLANWRVTSSKPPKWGRRISGFMKLSFHLLFLYIFLTMAASQAVN